MKSDFSKIPASLKGLRQWIVWKYGKRGGQLQKIPRDGKTGHARSALDPENWLIFTEAVEACKKLKLTGVGFVPTADDSYLFFDFDKCINNGKIASWLQALLEKLDSYSEVSVSGRGIHTVIKVPDFPDDYNSVFEVAPGRKIEAYFKNHYLTFTGNRLDGYKPYIREVPISELKTIFPGILKKAQKSPKKHTVGGDNLTDEQILKLCQNAHNSEKFKKLWSGDISDYPSQSEADAALCGILAFYTRGPEQLDRLFRQSQLYRQKWDQKHFGDGRTYGQATIQRAIENLTETYSTPQGGRENKRKTALKIDFLAMAQSFIDEQPLYYDPAKNWWMWTNQRWALVDETDILARIVLEQGIDEALSKRVRDVLFEALKILARRNKPKSLPGHYLQLRDCLFDLETGETLDPSRDFFITSTIPWGLGEQEATPTIDRLFADWVGDEQKAVLYEILAYCLLPSYPIHRMFILLGAGSNGKSSFIRLIKKFLGAQNCVSSELERLTGNIFEPARLYKKLVCFIGETNFNTLQRTSVLKQLTGEDPVSGQFKYKSAFDFTNYAKILIATNTLPQVQDKTDGFFRRTLIVHFPNQFKRNKDILAEIPDYEFENLVRKSIRVLNELLGRGSFSGEGSVSQKRQEYEDLSNPLKKFISEKCQDDPNGFIPSGEFYETFQAWLKDNKLRVWANREIAREMKELGYSYGRKRLKDKTQPRGWFGLTWGVPDVPEVPPVSNNFPYKENSLKVVEFAAHVAHERGEQTKKKDNKTVVKSQKTAKPCGLTPKSGGLTQEPEWLKQDFSAVDELIKNPPGEDDLVLDADDFKVVRKKR